MNVKKARIFFCIVNTVTSKEYATSEKSFDKPIGVVTLILYIISS